MTLRHQAPEMLFQRVSARAGEADHLADGHAAVLPRLIENLDGQRPLRALEFVDLGDQRQQFGRDLESFGIEHGNLKALFTPLLAHPSTHKYTPIHP